MKKSVKFDLFIYIYTPIKKNKSAILLYPLKINTKNSRNYKLKWSCIQIEYTSESVMLSLTCLKAISRKLKVLNISIKPALEPVEILQIDKWNEKKKNVLKESW